MTTLKTGTLDGKQIGYCSETEFLVQVAKGRSKYKTKFRTVGNLAQAVLLYNGINIGYGWRKRLLMPGCSKKPVLARAKS